MGDHRKLGRELDLFDSHPLVGSGLPIWLPAGAAVRAAIESFIKDEERRAGYQHVYSPPLGKRELYEISGHWQHFADDMFEPVGDDLVLRPSLCPHHALIYASRGRSYRDLPLRIAEVSQMFRAERSGVVGGLTRVRCISLNDAHLFCPLAAVGAEVAAILDMIERAYAALGITSWRYRLSLRGEPNDPKYIAGRAGWDQAEAMLREALKERDVEFEEMSGEAAFYGPKIDVQVPDSGGREWSLSTVQLDFHKPQRFDLSYVAADGSRARPVMVHRSVVGSMERLLGLLLEGNDGAFPPWCAPVQVAVLPISADQAPAAQEFAAATWPLRAEVSVDGSLGARVRTAATRHVPYVAVIGRREVERREVSLRERGGGEPLVLSATTAEAYLRAACSPAS